MSQTKPVARSSEHQPPGRGRESGFWSRVITAWPFWEGGGHPDCYFRDGKILQGKNATSANITSWVNSRHGTNWRSKSAGNAITYKPTSLIHPADTSQVSLLMLFTPRVSTDTNYYIRKIHSGTGLAASYRFGGSVAGTIAFEFAGSDASATHSSGASASLTLGTPCWYLGRWQSGGAPELRRYNLAGVLQESVTGTIFTGTYVVNTAESFAIGAIQGEYAALYALPFYLNATDPMFAQFIADPWWPFRAIRRRARSVPFQTLRPQSDVADGSWLNELGTNTNLYQSVDEAAPASDADYIQSSALPVADQVQLGLGPGVIAKPGTWTLSVRHKKL